MNGDGLEEGQTSYLSLHPELHCPAARHKETRVKVQKKRTAGAYREGRGEETLANLYL